MTPHGLAEFIANHRMIQRLRSLSREDRDDVCQEAFIAALPQLERMRHPAAFVCTILRRLAGNRIRELIAERERWSVWAVDPIYESDGSGHNLGDGNFPDQLWSARRADERCFRREQAFWAEKLVAAAPSPRHAALLRTYRDDPPDWTRGRPGTANHCGYSDAMQFARHRHYAVRSVRKVTAGWGLRGRWLL